MIAWLDNL